MANPIDVRAAVESEHNALRDAREKQYIADREALEAAYRDDLAGIQNDKEAALVAAGLNNDGSAPLTFDHDSPVNINAPVVTGTATTGQTLTSTSGTWSRADSLDYQWLRDGADVAEATDTTYVLVEADEGTDVSCRVTATNESGSTSAESNAISVPVPDPGP